MDSGSRLAQVEEDGEEHWTEHDWKAEAQIDRCVASCQLASGAQGRKQNHPKEHAHDRACRVLLCSKVCIVHLLIARACQNDKAVYLEQVAGQTLCACRTCRVNGDVPEAQLLPQLLDRSRILRRSWKG